MKNKVLLLSFVTAIFAVVAMPAVAQSTETKQEAKVERQLAKADKERLDDAKDLRNDTKADSKAAKASLKEAKRVENDAKDARRQAKKAAKMEEKTQQSRINADKQARKAARASEKSNNN
jgi:hypothetical protein